MRDFINNAWRFLLEVLAKLDLPEIVADNVKYLVPLLSMGFMFTLGAYIANNRWRKKLFPELVTGFVMYRHGGMLKKRTFLDGTLLSIWKESRKSRSIVHAARKKATAEWPILGFSKADDEADMIFDSICNHVSAKNATGVLMHGAGFDVPAPTLILSVSYLRFTRKYLRVAGIYLEAGIELLEHPREWEWLAYSDSDKKRLLLLKRMMALFVLEYEAYFRGTEEWRNLGFDAERFAALKVKAEKVLSELDPAKRTLNKDKCWIKTVEVALPMASERIREPFKFSDRAEEAEEEVLTPAGIGA